MANFFERFQGNNPGQTTAAQAPAQSQPQPRRYTAKEIHEEAEKHLATDLRTAVQNLEMIANDGYVPAMMTLADLYIKGEYGVKQDSTQFMKWTQKAAECGQPIACYNMGVTFANGHCGYPKDYERAIYWYTKSAEGGNADTQKMLGDYYQKGNLGLAVDYGKALYWYDKAAAQGNAGAYMQLAVHYLEGMGVDVNAVQALEYAVKAAKLGDGAAQNMAGFLYSLYKGPEIEKDVDKAVYWLQKAADQGILTAWYNLGCIYYNGRVIQPDYPLAAQYLEKGAEAGEADAANMLACMYRAGEGVPQDYAKAFQWFQRSAERNCTFAMYNMANMYEKGQYAPRNLAAAREWYQKAADRGMQEAANAVMRIDASGELQHAEVKSEAQAQEADYAEVYDLGLDYLYGENGREKNEEEAFKCFRQAAEAGCVQAFVYMGNFYRDGMANIPVDYRIARSWYEKAVAADSPRAYGKLANMYRYGEGVPQDVYKCKDLAMRGAELGDGLSKGILGELYSAYNGPEFPKDLPRALRWLQESVEQGFVGSYGYIGLIYYQMGNYPKMMESLEQGVAEGSGFAMDLLASVYVDDNHGAKRNLKEAARLAEMAYEQGFGDTMLALGQCYKYGYGVWKDPRKAREYFQKAIDCGVEDAVQELRSLR